MRRYLLSESTLTILLIVLYYVVKYFAPPVYANNDNAEETVSPQEVKAVSYETSAVDEGDWKTSEDHIHFIDYAKCITIVKNADSNEHRAYVVSKNRFETPEYLFSYAGWRGLPLAQKKALVSGSMTFLHEVLRLEICFTEEEKRRYDQYRTMVSVAKIGKHIDSIFRKPQYQDEDGEWLIVDYLQYNFRNYIGDPFAAFS